MVDQRFFIFSEIVKDINGIKELIFSTSKSFMGLKNKLLTSDEVEIDLKRLFGDKSKEIQKMKIQVLCEPENTTPVQYGQFLAESSRELHKTTFLFIIDLCSNLKHQKREFVKIKNIAQILSTFEHDLFLNAIIIFLHDENLPPSKESPEQILKPLLEKNDAFDVKLLELVRQENIFIKRQLDTKETYTNEKLKELFKIILPKQTQKEKVEKLVPKIHDRENYSPMEFKRISDIVNDSLKKLSTDINCSVKYQLVSSSNKNYNKERYKELSKISAKIFKPSIEGKKRYIESTFILTEMFHHPSTDAGSDRLKVENGVHATNQKDGFGYLVAENKAPPTNPNGNRDDSETGNIAPPTSPDGNENGSEARHDAPPTNPDGNENGSEARHDAPPTNPDGNENGSEARHNAPPTNPDGNENGSETGNIVPPTNTEPNTRKNISFEIVEALKELSSVINAPIRIVLIHIREDFNEKIYANILKLAENNSTGGKKVSEWQYTSILFQLSINDDEFINKTIKENSYLRTLIEKVNNRYACVTERMSTDETSRILKALIRTKFQESDCIKKRTEEPDEINLHKSVSILFNSANTTTEKETKISEHIPFSLAEKSESIITLTNSIMLTGQKSEVPLLITLA